jgi:hypothetical protein
MKTVVLKGWNVGLNKVALNKLLRLHAGMSLSEAKASVDDILEGKHVSLNFDSEDQLASFCNQAISIGVILDHPNEQKSTR